MDILAEVRENMHVVDADGKNLGKIKDFESGDPEAVTVGEDRHSPNNSFVGSSGILLDVDLPPEEVQRLAHSGWVRVHKGFFSHDRFIPADELDRVADDKLWLKPGIRIT